LPRKKIPIDLESLCRSHTEKSTRTIIGLMREDAVPPATRLACAIYLLDRGWGKPKQTTTVVGSPNDPVIVEIIQAVRDGSRSRKE
jgi:hypothetical protein